MPVDAKTALAKGDKDLLAAIFSELTERVAASPYASDDGYAKEISKLPIGLRAMAATHLLDISLTLDDIGWHFLNFGEENFVVETETGLGELGLDNLRAWFAEAYGIMKPYLKAIDSGTIVSTPDAYYEWLEQSRNSQRINELTDYAQDLCKGCSEDASGSVIYEAWIRYARAKPDLVFSTDSRA